MSCPPKAPQPVLIICMGVSGCGKTTLARNLAWDFGFTFLEADDFHSAENKAHMGSGNPLTDAMREPWIIAMCDSLREHQTRGESCVLAYSGLRRAHRARFRQLGFPTLFLHLAGIQDIIRQRLEFRPNHFMPSGLLDSQYAALEQALEEPDIVTIDVGLSVGEIHRQASVLVQEFLAQPSCE
jgi:gluconokinase